MKIPAVLNFICLLENIWIKDIEVLGHKHEGESSHTHNEGHTINAGNNLSQLKLEQPKAVNITTGLEESKYVSSLYQGKVIFWELSFTRKLYEPAQIFHSLAFQYIFTS